MRAKITSVISAALLLPMMETHAAQPVLQRGYDAGVTGANLAETTLTASNVTPGTFGLVFTLPVDDNVYAQSLYVPNVAIARQWDQDAESSGARPDVVLWVPKTAVCTMDCVR
ncbi:MAG: hypothetical protein ACLPX1_01205 [Steroidobacteraceae bacterium]